MAAWYFKTGFLSIGWFIETTFLNPVYYAPAYILLNLYIIKTIGHWLPLVMSWKHRVTTQWACFQIIKRHILSSQIINRHRNYRMQTHACMCIHMHAWELMEGKCRQMHMQAHACMCSHMQQFRVQTHACMCMHVFAHETPCMCMHMHATPVYE